MLQAEYTMYYMHFLTISSNTKEHCVENTHYNVKLQHYIQYNLNLEVFSFVVSSTLYV